MRRQCLRFALYLPPTKTSLCQCWEVEQQNLFTSSWNYQRQPYFLTTFNHPQSCKARNFFIRKSFLIMQRYSKALINDQTSTTQLKISHIIAPAFSWNYRNSPHFQTFKLQKILSSVLHHNLISDHAKRHWLIHLQDRLSTENFKPAEQMGKLKQDYHHYYSNIQRSHHAIYPKNDTTPAFRSERSDSNIP